MSPVCTTGKNNNKQQQTTANNNKQQQQFYFAPPSALLKMEKDGERISSAVTAAPIFTVGKKDGDEVRVCGDFSVTYNACMC
jgi:hypothetical protein